MGNNTSFIDAKLNDFFFEFIHNIDQRLAQVASASSSSSNTKNNSGLSEVVFEGICLDILQEIRQISERAAAQNRNLSAESIAEFSYVLAAWSDEILIRRFSSDFPEIYYGYTERTLFGTASAGEKVFEKIERLVSRRSQSDLALGSIYLIMLSLGFRGQYSVLDPAQSVLAHRKQLIAFATQTALEDGIEENEWWVPAQVSQSINVNNTWASITTYLSQIFNRKTASAFSLLIILSWVVGIFWINTLWLDAVRKLPQ